MSPEQVRCERDLDARTDLWSFAAILYRAVTGVKAFDGELGRILTAITSEAPRRPSEICSDLSPGVDAFFEKAFAQKRADRYQSVAELTAAFEAAVRRRAGTSGVRPKSVPSIDLEVPIQEGDRITPEHHSIPSDHPTASMPRSMLGQLSEAFAVGTALPPSSALLAPQTGLRLGEVIAPPAPPPSDRVTLPNVWLAEAPLTVEQEHGFSDPLRRSAPSPWDIDDGSGPTSLPARIEHRSSPYAAAGLAVIAAVAILTLILALVLR